MSGKLKWRFDASTFKLLGRGLITDRITAIYELVKNCYDANATTVHLEFHNVDKRSPYSRIIIRDNGLGMSLKDITDKWLVVGTSSKRTNNFSPEPYRRRYIGEKGVGRFATDKLGEHLIIKTKQIKDENILHVTINWNEYDRIANAQQVLFTDLENEYKYIGNDGTFPEAHGTELCITMLHEAWDKEMVLRLYNQLSRILSPIDKGKQSFNIFLTAPIFGFEDVRVESEPIENLATIHKIIPFDSEKNRQGTLVFNAESQDFEISYVPEYKFGLIKIEFYYFNSDAQKAFKLKYKNSENYIEGVKIYRDGVICTPFAEFESVLDTRRDILGIDKRRYQEAFDKLSSREIIGIVDITKDRNPEIIDATNRQDFVNNDAYRELKSFIISQIDVLANYKFIKRAENKKKIQNKLKKASSDVKSIEKDLLDVVKNNPSLKDSLAPIILKAREATSIVNEGVKDQEETEKEFLRKENLYLSLMSLQDFANDLAHGIRFAIAPAKHAAEFFVKNFPNPVYDSLFIKYSKLIFGQTEKISKLVNFMLSYAQIELDEATFLVKDLLDDILNGVYGITFTREKITVQIDVSANIQLTGNKKFLEDVISNLVSNSIKALKDREDKTIKCECFVNDDKLKIVFSDNGAGVDKKIESQIFQMFKTTTAEQGGAGLGLFIAEKRMNALNGKIEHIPSVFAPDGASFMLSIPLKKESK